MDSCRPSLSPPRRVELLDVLAARLRAAFFGDRSEEIRNLLRNVSAVRTGKRDASIWIDLPRYGSGSRDRGADRT